MNAGAKLGALHAQIAKGQHASNLTAKFCADGPIKVHYFANFASAYLVFFPGPGNTHPIIPIRKEKSFISSGLPRNKDYFRKPRGSNYSSTLTISSHIAFASANSIMVLSWKNNGLSTPA